MTDQSDKFRMDDFREEVDYSSFRNGILLKLFQDANICFLRKNEGSEYILSLKHKETNELISIKDYSM